MQNSVSPAETSARAGRRRLRPEGQHSPTGPTVAEGRGREGLPSDPFAVATGLVSSTTSVPGKQETPQFQASKGFQIDPFKTRANRMRKSLLTTARLHVEETDRGGYRPGFWAFVTFTYRPDVDYSPRHISHVIFRLRKWCAKRKIDVRYLWCLELTRAGKPHYHLMVRLPHGAWLPKPDKRGWWRHGSTRIEKARNAVGYMAKYASKCTPESVEDMPKGARSHGVGGLQPESRRELRYWRAPSFVRDALGLQADIRKMIGGYVNRVTGEVYESPWRVLIDGAGRIFAWKVEPS